MKRSTWDCATHDTELSPPRLDALSAAVARRLKSHYGGEQPNSTSVRVYDGYVVTGARAAGLRFEIFELAGPPEPRGLQLVGVERS